jgi:hypothetical protein
LAAEILKVKYFPYGGIIDANLGNMPLYVWRSIWSARDLLREGLIWRVGSREEIKIFKDKWIPQEVVRMFNTPGWGLFEDDVVAEIVWDTRWWNTSLLNVVFGGGDRKIAQIPLSSFNGGDKQI